MASGRGAAPFSSSRKVKKDGLAGGGGAQGSLLNDSAVSSCAPKPYLKKIPLNGGGDGDGSSSLLGSRKTQSSKRPTSRRKKWYQRWQEIRKSYLDLALLFPSSFFQLLRSEIPLFQST